MKPLILVVDDEKEFADSLVELLVITEKYDAISAYSAEIAFLLIKKNPVKLVLCDIKMPDMSGLEFLGELRKDYPYDKLGVMMLTAWEDDEKLTQAVACDVSAYFRKPINGERLMKTLDRFFAGHGEEMVNEMKKVLGKK